MSNMNFLIADVIQFVSGTFVSFSQQMEQKSNLSSSQHLASELLVLLGCHQDFKKNETSSPKGHDDVDEEKLPYQQLPCVSNHLLFGALQRRGVLSTRAYIC